MNPMSFGGSQGFGGKYQRRAAEGRRRFFIFIMLMAAIGLISYHWGAENVRSSESAYKQQAAKLQEERAGLDQALTTVRADMQSTQLRYQQLEEKYNAEVPTGDLKILTDILRKQLASGIRADRLTYLIDSARPPRNCSTPVTKRFVMGTSVYSGPHGNVAFANGAITVTGQGESAVGVGSKQEAWYDSGKPVTITFQTTGGKDIVKTGLLPIQHSIVLAAKEWRITVAAGERSFISVTADSCDYP